MWRERGAADQAARLSPPTGGLPAWALRCPACPLAGLPLCIAALPAAPASWLPSPPSSVECLTLASRPPAGQGLLSSVFMFFLIIAIFPGLRSLTQDWGASRLQFSVLRSKSASPGHLVEGLSSVCLHDVHIRKEDQLLGSSRRWEAAVLHVAL